MRQSIEQKCVKCGWYDIGCTCGESDNPPVLNRAQRRALKHSKRNSQ